MTIVLSHLQVWPLLAGIKEGKTSLTISPDLGISQIEVTLDQQGVCFPSGEIASWEDLHEVAKAEVSCFSLDDDGKLRKIQIFSEQTGRFYSLMPTRGAPTMLLSGIPMHRIKDIDPHQDTLLKIQTIKPVVGAVLDTTMGLGYTAIEAARTAAMVTTVELDPAVVILAAQNPWSHELFNNPKINQITGDSFDVISTFADGTFSRIIHDPPMFSLAGDLYSGEFYRQLYRVMKYNGRLFHYIGDLDSTSGSRTAKGASRRLEEA
ncbi:MAG: spermine synthase, partial [Anaerolineaceae bacterium]|nr:spermine synthase [Anaerolineaceae bacterium]